MSKFTYTKQHKEYSCTAVYLLQLILYVAELCTALLVALVLVHDHADEVWCTLHSPIAYSGSLLTS